MKKKKVALTVTLLIILGSILFTTELSLRLAVFCVSPYSAVTMKYEHYKKESKWCELYRITKNAPHEEQTDGDLVIWAVYKLGPLHYSKYFGWE